MGLGTRMQEKEGGSCGTKVLQNSSRIDHRGPNKIGVKVMERAGRIASKRLSGSCSWRQREAWAGLAQKKRTMSTDRPSTGEQLE